MNQTWSGIDPGLATIGWAFLGSVDETEIQLLEFGTIETSKELTTSKRLLEIEQDMVELLAEFQPAHIAIEQKKIMNPDFDGSSQDSTLPY